MSNDPNPPLLAEWEAARVVLVPMIDGMTDTISLRHETLSDPARNAVQDGLEKRTTRAQLLDNAISAYHNLVAQMDALTNDGYPKLPKFDVSPAIAAELSGQKSDIDIALGEFVTDTSAQTIKTGPVSVEPKS